MATADTNSPLPKVKDAVMKSSRPLAGLITCLVAVAAIVAQADPLTDVVYGNLGNSGTNGLGSISSNIGPGDPGEVWVAQGFVTGSASNNNLNLASIALGLKATSSSTSATVSVYMDNSGAPGTLFATSSALTIDSTSQQTYVFPFALQALSANTTYWVVPSAGVQWFYAENTPSGAWTPSGKNGSGYVAPSPLKTLESNTVDIVPGNWGEAASDRFAISVQAVPEPSTYALSAIGVIATGVMQWRRRAARKAR